MSNEETPTFDKSIGKAREGLKAHVPNRAHTHRQGRLTNFTEYFREEHDVWVRTLSGTQVSINFNLGHGDSTSFVIPATGDPYNLSQRFPWDVIKRSSDIRHFVAGRKKPLMQLMMPEEAEAYYEQKAKKAGLSVDEAMMKAERKRDKMYSMQPLDGPTNAPVTETAEQPINDDNILRTEEVVKSRVIHLCHQVDAEIPINQRWDAKRLLEELESIEPTLGAEDFQYIIGHGRYRSLVRWADVRLKAKLTEDTDEGNGGFLEDDIGEDRIALK